MSSSMITVSVTGAVLLFLMIIFLLQMRERMRDERVRQVNNLIETVLRIRRMLTDIPPGFISKAIRIRLLERSIEIIGMLKSLDKRERENMAAELRLSTAELEEAQRASFDEQPAPIQSEEQAMEVRKLLKLLYRFIETEHQEGRLDTQVARDNLAQVSFLISRTLADVFVSRALALQTEGKYRAAIDQYHNALEALSKSRVPHLVQPYISAYRQKIKELDQMASQSAQNKSKAQSIAAAAAAADQSNKLSEQWERIMSEEDKWKKKQAYDD